jgi:secretion/DNA translocation related TadE-like protein
VVVIGLCAVLGAAAAFAVLLGGVVAARHRAGAAADFAAIAAAQHAYDGAPAACRAAAQIAAANRAQVESCRLRGQTVEVRVAVPVPGPMDRIGPAHATARAGPVAPDP